MIIIDCGLLHFVARGVSGSQIDQKIVGIQATFLRFNIIRVRAMRGPLKRGIAVHYRQCQDNAGLRFNKDKADTVRSECNQAIHDSDTDISDSENAGLCGACDAGYSPACDHCSRH